MWSTQLFDPGRVVTTPGVGAVLDQFDGPTQVRLVIGLLIRHITGDWGEVDSDDQAANDHAVIQGERVLSAYRLPDETKVWVIHRGRPVSHHHPPTQRLLAIPPRRGQQAPAPPRRPQPLSGGGLSVGVLEECRGPALRAGVP